MAKLTDLNDLFVNLLRDIYYAEKKILKVFPKQAKALGKNSRLAAAFEKHMKETEEQLARLDKVFALINEKPKSKTCEAMDGLVKEAGEVMQNSQNQAVMEAGLLADAQAVKHYEISRYGTLVEWAKMLGYGKAAKLLQDTLKEEKKTDELLNVLSMREINERALHARDSEGKKMMTRRRASW